MAGSPGNSSPGNRSGKVTDTLSSGDLVDQLTVIAEAVQQLQTGQQSLQSLVESKLDKFKNDFIASIDEKFKAMRAGIDLDLAVHKKNIDSLSQSVDSIIRRLEKIEQSPSHTPINRSSSLNDPNLTVIATNVEETDEPVLDVAREIIGLLDEDVDVLSAGRLKGRYGKPGLVKIALPSLEEKKAILREKKRLKETEKYKTTFIRSSKSHTERLIELNARTILSEIPQGKMYSITANGRIVKKANGPQQPNNPDGER
jgi:hypothetical protein